MNRIGDKIRGKLPSWFRMKHDPASVGWQLIDVIAKNVERAGAITEYAERVRNLKAAPTSQPFICYSSRLSAICFEKGNTFTLIGDGKVLNITYDIWDFISSAIPDLNVPHLYQHETAYIDKETMTVYVLKPYGADDKRKNGYITLNISRQDGSIFGSHELLLSKQPLWTSFDEIGILLSTPRLPEEDNESYRKRLIAASRLSCDASKRGMVRAIAKELGLFEEHIWPDGGTDFIIPHKHVNVETIIVDDEPVSPDDVIKGQNGQYGIKGRPEYAGKQRRVMYAYGIKLRDLSTDADPEVVSLLYDKEGFPTEYAVRLKEEIDRSVPVKWDYFVWGDAFWDSGSYSLLRNMYDGSVTGFVR